MTEAEASALPDFFARTDAQTATAAAFERQVRRILKPGEDIANAAGRLLGVLWERQIADAYGVEKVLRIQAAVVALKKAERDLHAAIYS